MSQSPICPFASPPSSSPLQRCLRPLPTPTCEHCRADLTVTCSFPPPLPPLLPSSSPRMLPTSPTPLPPHAGTTARSSRSTLPLTHFLSPPVRAPSLPCGIADEFFSLRSHFTHGLIEIARDFALVREVRDHQDIVRDHPPLSEPELVMLSGQASSSASRQDTAGLRTGWDLPSPMLAGCTRMATLWHMVRRRFWWRSPPSVGDGSGEGSAS